MSIDPPKAGERYGSLTLTGKYEYRKLYQIHCEVTCLCGKTVWKRRVLLISGKNERCGGGCSSPLNKRRITKGDRSHHLVATGNSRRTDMGNTVYEFMCDCGRTAFFNSSAVLRERTKTCCHIDCRLSKKEHHGKASHTNRERHPGGSIKWSKEYAAWCMAKVYCYNKAHPAYKNTGGKGAVMCDEWKNSFVQFNKDMGDAPSSRHRFTRKDKSGDYDPDNCYWRAPKGWAPFAYS